MRPAIPEECFLTLSAEITPELARRFPDRMNLLFQAQLVSRSVSDLSSALRLLLELSREVVPWDHGALFWRNAPDKRFRLKESLGTQRPETIATFRQYPLADTTLMNPKALLVDADRCCTPALARSLASAEISGVLVLPLYANDQVMGSLCLFRHGGEAFEAAEAHLLRVFSFSFEAVVDSMMTEESQEQTFTDRLTGLFSRHYFDQQLEREMDRGRRTNEPVALVLVRIQNLDQVRTVHGQASGDALLHEVGQALARTCRKSDTLSRLANDLYGIILPRTGKDQLGPTAQRLFAGLEGPFLGGIVGEGSGADVVFQIGAVAYPDDAYAPESLVEAARQALEEVNRESGLSYFQFPLTPAEIDRKDLLDATRMGLLREPLVDPSRLLKLFVRLCLDTVPADRVSMMVRDGDDLVIQIAYGFEGQEEIIRTSRIPLSDNTVSGWVTKHREPVLVSEERDLSGLPASNRPSYRNASFISFPLIHEDRVLGVLHFSNRSDGGPFSEEDLERFRPLGKVLSRFLALGQSFSSVQEDYLRDSLAELVDTIENQVPGMGGHSKEVSRIAVEMARNLGYDDESVERIRVSSRLQDLGKISYRATVLAEPRALSTREREVAQRHPLLSWKFLEGVPLKRIDRDAILYHHEREDGSGYLHKAGNEIPESAKILAVADVYQALISPRPYRPAVTVSEALRYLETNEGTLFAPRAVGALRTVIEAGNGST